MHALQAVHTALRPHGLLLDLQPEPEDERIEVVTRNGVVHVGDRNVPEFTAKTRAARAALAKVVAAGWFRRDTVVTFPFVGHAESVEAWLAYRAAKGSQGTVHPGLLARTRAMLAGGGWEIRIRESVTATRLRRLERR